jgi:hypothetical protein
VCGLERLHQSVGTSGVAPMLRGEWLWIQTAIQASRRQVGVLAETALFCSVSRGNRGSSRAELSESRRY